MKQDLFRPAVLAGAVLAGVAGAAALHAPPAAAQDYYAMSCDQLWYARNAIYAAKGHCFKTQRGLAVFGPRCFPPYGQLNHAEQQEVNRIVQAEREKGCR